VNVIPAENMPSSSFDKLEAITKQLWAAVNSKSICSIKLKDENGYRIIFPHGIFMTKQKKLSIACWQKSGFSEKGISSGYKNLSLEKCETVMMLNKKFYKRKDFNPEDDQYGEWLFHI
jgi:hypothetical protein